MQPKISSLGTALNPAVHIGPAQLLKIASQVCSIWKLLSNKSLEHCPLAPLSFIEVRQIRDCPFSTHRNKTSTQKWFLKEWERSKTKIMKNNPFLFCDLATYLNCLLPSFSESKLWDKGSQCYAVKYRGTLLKPFKLSKWKVVCIALVYFLRCQFSRWLCPLLKPSSR